jgi:hypothetical protein|tara:strand:+ start:7034 stop:7312 length:279 start_codon:yes stop_codon:yes gene_type:complete
MIYETDYYSSAWLALEGVAGASYTVSTKTENAAPTMEQPWWNSDPVGDTPQFDQTPGGPPNTPRSSPAPTGEGARMGQNPGQSGVPGAGRGY